MNLPELELLSREELIALVHLLNEQIKQLRAEIELLKQKQPPATPDNSSKPPAQAPKNGNESGNG